MALDAKRGKKLLKKDFNKIIAPLGGMIKDLEDYDTAQKGNERELEAEKAIIQQNIDVSKSEQTKAGAMGSKLKVLTDPNKKLVTEDVEEKPVDLINKIDD